MVNYRSLYLGPLFFPFFSPDRGKGLSIRYKGRPIPNPIIPIVKRNRVSFCDFSFFFVTWKRRFLGSRLIKSPTIIFTIKKKKRREGGESKWNMVE